MNWQSSQRLGEIEQLIDDLEKRLTRLSRIAGRSAQDTSSQGANKADRVGDAIAGALSDLADRFRGRTRHIGDDVGRLGNEALQFGNTALRKLTHEVERRPLVTLAVAVGVGLLAAGLLASRRS